MEVKLKTAKLKQEGSHQTTTVRRRPSSQPNLSHTRTPGLHTGRKRATNETTLVPHSRRPSYPSRCGQTGLGTVSVSFSHIVGNAVDMPPNPYTEAPIPRVTILGEAVSESQEEGPHQELRWPAPRPWTSRPPEP